MSKILVHEFISLDGVFEDPSWTFDFGFDPKMGETLAGVTGACKGILLGRRTYEMFYPAWSQRTAEDDPGAPFFNESPKFVVSSTRSGMLVRGLLADGGCFRRARSTPSSGWPRRTLTTTASST